MPDHDDVSLDAPRAWIEFADPADDSQRLRCDLTWLTSRYSCIFGNGCPGIDASLPDAGCCTLGAHFSDGDDEKRVAGIVKRLGPDDWENYSPGRSKKRWIETDADGDRKTRTTESGCIFLNSPDFAGGGGCALHGYALRHGMEPLETKPDVCWQLPIRRLYREVDVGDGDTYLEITITEYDRRGWGEGGHDFDWYCTGNPTAHASAEPLYVSSRAELVAMIGEPAYDVLAEHCAEHLEQVDAAARGGRRLLTLHLADPDPRDVTGDS